MELIGSLNGNNIVEDYQRNAGISIIMKEWWVWQWLQVTNNWTALEVSVWFWLVKVKRWVIEFTVDVWNTTVKTLPLPWAAGYIYFKIDETKVANGITNPSDWTWVASLVYSATALTYPSQFFILLAEVNASNVVTDKRTLISAKVNTTYGTTAPSTPEQWYVWCDTSVSPYLLKVYSWSARVVMNPKQTTAGSSAPSSPSIWDIRQNTTTWVQKYWNWTAWTNTIIWWFGSWIIWRDVFAVNFTWSPQITYAWKTWVKIDIKKLWKYHIKIISNGTWWSYTLWKVTGWSATNLWTFTVSADAESWNYSQEFSSAVNDEFIVEWWTNIRRIELIRWYDFSWQNSDYISKFYYLISWTWNPRSHLWYMSSWITTPNVKIDTDSMSVINNTPLYSLSWWQFTIAYTWPINVSITSEIYTSAWWQIWHEIYKNWVVVQNWVQTLPSSWFPSSMVKTTTYSWTINSWDVIWIKMYWAYWVVSNWPFTIKLW